MLRILLIVVRVICLVQFFVQYSLCSYLARSSVWNRTFNYLNLPSGAYCIISFSQVYIMAGLVCIILVFYNINVHIYINKLYPSDMSYIALGGALGTFDTV